MIITISGICLVIAFIIAVLAALQMSTPRLNLIALALALFILSFLTGCAEIQTSVKTKYGNFTYDSKG